MHLIYTFRSDEIEKALIELGIRKAPYLWSDHEVEKYRLPELETEGIDVERVGVVKQARYDHTSLESRLQGYADDRVNVLGYSALSFRLPKLSASSELSYPEFCRDLIKNSCKTSPQATRGFTTYWIPFRSTMSSPMY